MAQTCSTTLAASAVCFLSLLIVAHCQSDAASAGAASANANGKIEVEGMVFCDNCRVRNITTVSAMIAGAKVKLDCKGSGGTNSFEGVTDQYGNYRVDVTGGLNEVCEISLVSSGDPNCAEVSPNSRVTLNLKDNQGMVSAKRLAEPISFMTKQPAPACAEALQEEQQSS
ncbi:olee1-like protein [Argentina anserina]|uniref:olee1-like protein n=1 Tax=Argentina anserina TaxID=57926 RepID=UPI0021765378|nr:olee1-like protein [Potentilla anserina]